MSTLSASDTSSIATHHMTSQPPPLVPSSLISIERLRHLPDASTQSSHLLNLNTITDTNLPASVLIDDVTTDTGTFAGHVAEDHAIDTLALSVQRTVMDPTDATDLEDAFQNSQTMNKRTYERVTEDYRNANIRVDSKISVSESASIETFTIGANNSEQKASSVTTIVPEDKQLAPTDSVEGISNSHLQPYSEYMHPSSSVPNNLQLMHDTHIYTEGEGRTQSSAMDSATSEVTPLQSTLTTSDFSEDDVLPNEDTVTMRLKRSVFSEATQQNTMPPHQNDSFDVMETVVDWGGVSVLSLSFETEVVCIGKAVIYGTVRLDFAQNCWGPGPCPSSEFLKTSKHNISEK
jgi:hypothetical protein